jgi:hypothetical protein
MKKLEKEKAKRMNTRKCRLLTSVQPHSRPATDIVTAQPAVTLLAVMRFQQVTPPKFLSDTPC